MQSIVKQNADAYDRLIDAAENLADMISGCGIEMDEFALEELTIFLASNADKMKNILKNQHV
jgi:dsDNA-binding SOS-regulon protein